MAAYNNINGYGYIYNRLKALLVLGIPFGADLPTVDADTDIKLFYKTGSGLYLFDGTAWNPIGGEGVGSFEPVIAAPGDPNLFWNGNKEWVPISTDAMTAAARAALSVALGSALTYNSTTGVFDVVLPEQVSLSADSPIDYDPVTGKFTLDLTILDQRYQPSLEEYNIGFENGLQRTGDTVIALTDNALWNARKLRGYLVTAKQPTDGQILIFDQSLNTWVLGTVDAGAHALTAIFTDGDTVGGAGTSDDPIRLASLPQYANNTAALAAGLAYGKLYRMPYNSLTDCYQVAVVGGADGEESI